MLSAMFSYELPYSCCEYALVVDMLEGRLGRRKLLLKGHGEQPPSTAKDGNLLYWSSA